MHILVLIALMVLGLAPCALAQVSVLDVSTRYQMNAKQALTFGSSLDSLFVGSGGSSNTGNKVVMVGNSNSASNSGDENIFVGFAAGQSNTSGEENLFVGTWAGRDNTSASGNTYVGYMAGRMNILGQQNTYLGWGSRSSVTTGSFNTFVGYQAGGEVGVSGDHNVGVGLGAGQFNGNWNTAIGQNAGSGGAAVSNSISLGAGAVPTASNQLLMGGDASGNGRITSVYIGQGVTNATAAAVTVNTTGGSGLNIPGAAFNLAAGVSTGNATPSSLVFFTGAAGGSGTTPQTNLERWRIDGAAGGNLTAANGANIIVPALKSNSGTRFVCVDTTGAFVSQTTACSGT